MTQQLEAMKLALEALVGDRAFLESDAPVEIWGVNDRAITGLRQAIEQAQKQKPHGWYIDGYGAVIGTAEPKSVRVGEWLPWYTSPPQRQPLTDEQLMIALLHVDGEAKRLPIGFRAFARAIEAAHGIKGEA